MHTKEKIKLAGIELFSILGYEATSMSKIAEKVGIKKPSLYAHYKNKEEIFMAVVDQMCVDYVEFTEASLAKSADTEEERLFVAFLDHVLHFYSDETENQFYNRILLYPPSELEEQLTKATNESQERVNAVMENAIKRAKMSGEVDNDLDERDVVFTYFCLLEGIGNTITLYSLTDIERNAKKVWDIFWRGIKKSESR
ncbi:TetR/AcrR family transcriptional regulator [Bacillus horti]|uniref:AcrR family transcriptional regulator n=1 Tax=Caldalkalibacillus horti TaxID=77523 RepID=A0ABT9VVE5_9BACI|nr:TetR/AcrR family transcriptional regulator [Bacillus horti]MDQ0164968.1 AcrR family transcriptional regulator [Bacillus horti]